MGNRSSSVSLDGERRAGGIVATDAAIHSPAKPSFRETLFKHRKSFRDNRATSKTTAKANGGLANSGGSGGSSAATSDAPSKSNGDGRASSVGHPTSPAASVQFDDHRLQASATAVTTATFCRVDSENGVLLTPTDNAMLSLSTSEPTYEEIRTGASPPSDSAFTSSPLSEVGRPSGIPPSRLSSYSDAVAEASSKTQIHHPHVVGESRSSHDPDAVGGSGGSGARSFLAAFRSRGSAGKKNKKKRKSLGSHVDGPPSPDPDSMADAAARAAANRSSGGSSNSSNRQSNTRQSGSSSQLDGGSGGSGRQAKSCNDASDLVNSAATHRRAASYDRQLPDLPVSQASSSDETVPKQRCSDDSSPKHRRALPDIPQELSSAVEPGDTAGEQIYSAVTDMPPPGAPPTSAPPCSDDDAYDKIQCDRNPTSVKADHHTYAAVAELSGDTAGDQIYSAVTDMPPPGAPCSSTPPCSADDDDAYDKIQRDRNPTSVKADHRTYAAVAELPAPQSVAAVASDGTYDILQRDKNPLSVKIKQLKSEKGNVADDDQYSKAIETPSAGITADPMVDSSDEIYCEADAVKAPAVTVMSVTAAAVVQASGSGSLLAVIGGSRNNGVAAACSQSDRLPQSIGLQISSANDEAADRRSSQHPQYSAVRPVAPKAHNLPGLLKLIDSNTFPDPEQAPRVPEKRFDLSDETSACDGMVPPALEPSAVFAGEDDDSELYSLPLETPSAAATAAGCLTQGDFPAGYGIITLREPLSMVQERLAAAEGQVAMAEESDYYESVDKVQDVGAVPSGTSVATDLESGVHGVPLQSGPESDAGEMYAVPDELVNATGSVYLPPVPPPVPHGIRRRQTASTYEEITLPPDGKPEVSTDVVSGSTKSKRAGGATRSDGDNQLVVVADRNAGAGPSQVRIRRCGYEEVDLPSTSTAKPLASGNQEATAAVAADGGDTGILVMPPPVCDRPLARPLASRGRLVHHYEQVDGHDEGGRLATAFKAGARQPHHYDEIEDVRLQST